MRLFGIRYYVSYTPEAQEAAAGRPELNQVAASGPFVFYELADAPLVEAARYLPAVYEGPHNSLLARLGGVFGIGPGDDMLTFDEFSLEWYDRLDLLDRWITTDGPESWPRITSLDQLAGADPNPVPAHITDVVIDEDRISFQTDAVGMPHLVKVSYFPNWRTVGAEGPYHAGPSFMVVIPTQEDVTLEFANTAVESAGWLATIVGLGAAGAGLIQNRTRTRPHPAGRSIKPSDLAEAGRA